MIVWSTRWSEIRLNEKYSSTQHFCLCSDTKSLKSTVIVTPLHWVSWALNQGPRILFNYYKEISAAFYGCTDWKITCLLLRSSAVTTMAYSKWSWR